MDKPRSVEDCQTAPRPIAALATEHADGEHIAPHRHVRAQLIHAVTGVMTVVGASGSWVVPTGRAVWMPAQAEHQIRIAGDVAMRTVFVDARARPGMPDRCEVIEVSPLLREAIVAATTIALDYAARSRDERVMELILDELDSAPRLALHVPLPLDARLRRACERIIAAPARTPALDALARSLHMSGRTLARAFQREVGMSYAAWLRRLRLLLSLQRLAAGASVLEVALEHGYASPSAFSAMFRRELGVSPSGYLADAKHPRAAESERA
ncbi:MAG: helix-turn-helix transcriptional regulator [Rudaea sp.]|uniref:AraC family transcriptional regulator n=1 Tax=unclassified Rudaea TaxID=2627037 RepID=UPI0010F96956|nr:MULTISPECIES: helix-turn-helix transcriptional regulator [unclassified Rudaea]MBN8887093.1 helix-turn-helix transcriptional regulator [Rudaea sp.]MBR0347185.1 helix-turn-helix transcriptional regulator [Rudaea sp.]